MLELFDGNEAAQHVKGIAVGMNAFRFLAFLLDEQIAEFIDANDCGLFEMAFSIGNRDLSVAVQPQLLVDVVHVLKITRLDVAEQSFDFVENQRKDTLVLQVRETLVVPCIVFFDQIVDAHRRMGIVQIQSNADVANRLRIANHRIHDQTAYFRAAIRVDVIWPLQSDVQILENSENKENKENKENSTKIN